MPPLFRSSQPSRMRLSARKNLRDTTARPMHCESGCNSNSNSIMTPLILAYTPILAAAGWAFMTYLLGGGAGLAILVFILLKVMGK